MSKKEKNLTQVKKGTIVKVIHLPEGLVRSQFIRFGIVEGDTIKCIERLPGGTILIQKNRQEIAIGRNLALNILVNEKY